MRCSSRTVGSSEAAASAAVFGREAAAAVPGRVPPVDGRAPPGDMRPVDGRESPGPIPLVPFLLNDRADAGAALPRRGDAARAPKLVVAPRAGTGSGGSVAETGSSSSASAASPALRFARN